MPQLIDRIAELTGFRDRDLLDGSVVRSVNDVLRPLVVGIYRTVGESGGERWLTRARMDCCNPAATADPLWTDISALPELGDVPGRLACLSSAEVVTVGEAPQLTYFPISTERAVVGVLELETVGALAPSDRAMVSTILRIYGNFHDLLDHSERDPLTGLLNRQTFNAVLMARPPIGSGGARTDKRRRAPCEDAAVWLGVADIDHFKRVNDTFGHPIGDEVLLLLSRLLRSSFRHHDRLYRFGGEEFVVVMNCVQASQTALAFERLRANVERFEFPQVGRVTVSVGFTQTSPAETPSSAFARADRALYFAKENGRNRVAQFEELVRQGFIVDTHVAGDVELF
jgi:diguanylate cyclase (GGDEF)-like protein